MTQERAMEPIEGRTRRLSVGGRLSFRRRVPQVLEDPDLPLVVGGDDPPRLDEIVPDGFRSVEIEVGPGKGAFLLSATAARPEAFVLGIEAAPAYARYAAARLRDSGRDNGLLLVDNAALFLVDRVPEGSVDRLHVYFPDPWPKRRHRGRRFFHDGVAPGLWRLLVPGGLVLVATDNSAYAGQICRVLGSSALFSRDEKAEQNLLEAGEGHAFTPTNFEAKYRAEGRTIRRYAWRRTDG